MNQTDTRLLRFGAMIVLVLAGVTAWKWSGPDSEALLADPAKTNGSSERLAIPDAQPTAPREPIDAADLDATAAESSADAESADVSGTILLSGRVLDDLGAAFVDATVVAMSMDGVIGSKTTIAAQGRFELRLAPGAYLIGIEPRSLPVGFAPPMVRATPRCVDPSRFECPRVDLQLGEEPDEVTVHVFRESQVHGMIVDTTDRPAPNVVVMLMHVGNDYHPPTANLVETTDADGAFTFAQPFSGFFRLQVSSGSVVNNEFIPGPTPPPPVELELQSGGFYDVGALRLGGDGIRVSGRIVNQDGECFAGLTPQAYYDNRPHDGWVQDTSWTRVATATTNADGEFAFEDQFQAPLRIALVQFEDYDVLGEDPVVYWVHPVLVDLSTQPTGSERNLGDFKVLESRP